MEWELVGAFAKDNPALAFYVFLTVYVVKFWHSQKAHASSVEIIKDTVVCLRQEIREVIRDTDRKLVLIQQDLENVDADLTEVRREVQDLRDGIDSLDCSHRRVASEVENLKRINIGVAK